MVQINTLNPSCGCEYGKTQHIVTLIYLFYHMLWLSNKPSQCGSVVQRKTYSTPIVQGNGGTHLFP